MDLANTAPDDGHDKHLGVYTKTLIESPVVRWILHVRIRDSHRNDVLLVGDDFVHVEQLESQGHLRHIATKRNFDSRILAASTLRTGPKASTDDLFIKQDPDGETKWPSETPPERLVLAMSTDELLFIYLCVQDDGTYEFIHHRLCLPSSSHPIYSLGQHLCVDHESRAIAVAAMERELWICSIGNPGTTDSDSDGLDVLPGSAVYRVSFQVQGVIQNMSFLTPRPGDEDHIILLLIVIDSGRTKAVWIDGYHSLGLENAQQHPGQALDSDICTSSLLIPLRDASFLLVKGQEITYWKDLLSGSATAYIMRVDTVEPKQPGSSSRVPAWASWTWPCRNLRSRRHRDDLYLAREDGPVYLLSADCNSMIEMSFAGDLDCHVGTAFAALGDEFDPDILAVAGDMSNGRIVTIGAFFESEHLSRKDAMSMSLTQWLPNWASTIDMIPSDLGATASITRLKHSHGFYVTAGRQPYGSIVELRRGLELQTSAYFSLDGLKSVTDIWALPDLPSGSVFIIISRPTTTQLLQVSSDVTEVDEVVGMTSIVTSERTLAAGILSRSHFVQVTCHNISITRSLHAGSEGTKHIMHDESVEITVAVVVAQLNAILYVCCTDSQYVLEYRSFVLDDETEETWLKPATVTSLPLDFRPLCMAVTSIGPDIVIAVATTDNRIGIRRGSRADVEWCFSGLPKAANDEVSVCDHIAILHSTVKSHKTDRVLVVCGLRDGRVVSYHLDFEHAPPFRAVNSISLSNSTVKLVQSDFMATSLIAISGTDICLLEWAGETPCFSSVDNIWASDRSRPNLSQGPVAACAMMPPSDTSSPSALADSLIMVCQDEILVGPLKRCPSTIPREIPVSGTPNRLIYSQELRCLICSSECSGTRPTPMSKPHGASSDKRQRWPVIDFIPVKNTVPSFTHKLQPGERIQALLPWSHRSNEGKTYSYILVGGSYLKSNGIRRGRVSLLQPQVRSREVVALLNDPHNIKFEDEVFALGKYDATTFIACSGDYVYVYRFFVEIKKWDQLCPPFRLASPGLCISVMEEHDGHGLITVSTARDSIVVLILRQISSAVESDTAFKLFPISMGPRAEICQNHLTVSIEGTMDWVGSNETIALVSTKDACLVGLRYPRTGTTAPTTGADVRWKQAETVFHAVLSGSLRRIWKCEPFDRKGRPPAGVMDCRIVASRTDGAVVGIALLDRNAWRRLAWLQRLCEWSEEMSPCLVYDPPYAIDREAGELGQGRRFSIGLGDASTSVKLQSRSEASEDYHINGDIIGRVLRRGGLEALKKVLHRISEMDHGPGVWIRDHLEEELRAADEIVEVVEGLHSWM